MWSRLVSIPCVGELSMLIALSGSIGKMAPANPGVNPTSFNSSGKAKNLVDFAWLGLRAHSWVNCSQTARSY